MSRPLPRPVIIEALVSTRGVLGAARRLGFYDRHGLRQRMATNGLQVVQRYPVLVIMAKGKP